MNSAVKKTISLPADLARETEALARAEGKTLSAVVQDALRRARIERQLQELRGLQGYWSRKARDQGILTEKDLERYLRECRSSSTRTFSSRLWSFLAGAAKRRCGALSKSRTGSLSPSLFSMSCSAFSRASFRVMLKSSPMSPFFSLTSLSPSSRGGNYKWSKTSQTIEFWNARSPVGPRPS
jgi:hypothetical protein